MNIFNELLNKSTIQLFIRAVEKGASDVIDAQEGRKYYAHIAQLKQYFKSINSVNNPEVIYNKLFKEFYLKYGFANLIKNYYVISELFNLGILNNLHNITDIGSGPGTFTLAYLLWLKEHSVSNLNNINIRMVDAVKNYFILFDSIWENLEIKEKNNIKINYYNDYINRSISKYTISTDIIVFSNSICEIMNNKKNAVNSIIKSIIDSNAVLVFIDYKYPKTIKTYRYLFDKLNPYYNKHEIYLSNQNNNDLTEIDFNSIENPWRKCSSRKLNNNRSNVKFVKSILIPKNKKDILKNSLPTQIVNLYKKAWEEHDTPILGKIFSKNAIYIEKKNISEYYGINEIYNYWDNNSKLQSQIRFSPIYIDMKINLLKLLWRCIFYRRDLKHWLELNGNINAIIHKNKIEYFIENFKKKVFKRNPDQIVT